MAKLGVTVAGEPLPHLLYRLRFLGIVNSSSAGGAAAQRLRQAVACDRLGLNAREIGD